VYKRQVLNWNIPAINFYENSGAVVLEDWRVAQMSEKAIGNFIENKVG
jgi:hypothetical protein